MALITLTTDFGESDHYVGALKAGILSKNPQQSIVDISHRIKSCDLAHGAYVVKNAMQGFPAGTVHLVAVDSIGNQGDVQMAVELEDHFLLLTDNGLLGLVSDEEPKRIVALPWKEVHPSPFPACDILVPAAVELAQGRDLSELGSEIENYQRMLGRRLRATREQILGHVIRVDHYGNLITNIDQETFCQHIDGRNFQVIIGRENFTRINHSINETGSGDCFLIFNSMGLLEIGINKGRASQLLGLKFDSPVKIVFDS